MKWNLKNRITVPTVALVVIIATTLSLVSFLKSRNMLDTILTAQLNDQCAASIVQIEDWMEAQRQNLMQLSSLPYMAAALQSAPERQTSRDLASAQLAKARDLHPYYQEINLLDSTGLSVASSNPNSTGKLNLSDRQYFKDAYTDKTVISRVLASRTSGNPVVVIATPIKDGDTIRGVLELSLDLNTFSSQYISSRKILQTGYEFMFDEQGVVVAHPDKSKIFKTQLTEYDWGRKMLEMHNGQVSYNFVGVDKSTIFKTSDVLHWGLAITVPAAELNAPIYQMGKISVILSVCALAAGIVIMLLTAHSIARPLHRLADDLLAGAGQTTSAAAQVASSSQSLAEGSSHQASSLEETSSSLEEMAAMTKRNAESARQAKELAKETREAADKGAGDMQTMASAMNAIKVSSDDVAKIIKTIDEIAFQTNILALNAAVEAARAGEAGMGFAVVADEVRNLAQRCAHAAKETSSKIEGAIAKTGQGVEISTQVAATLNEIVAKVRQVDELIAEVAGSSREQTEGIAQINAAVGKMDQVTQSNAASAEESAAAAEELSSQAEIMRQSVSDLLNLVGGNGANGPEAASSAPAPLGSGIPKAPARPASHHRNGKTNGHAQPLAEFRES